MSYRAVLNGRYKGSHITREHSRSAEGVHAVQLEITQCGYIEEAMPFDYLPERVAGVQPHLRRMIEATLAFAQGRGMA
jgi:N-formylglutamate deformylase